MEISPTLGESVAARTNVACTGLFSPTVPSLLARAAASLVRGGRSPLALALELARLSCPLALALVLASASANSSVLPDDDTPPAASCFASHASLILRASLAPASSPSSSSDDDERGTTTV